MRTPGHTHRGSFSLDLDYAESAVSRDYQVAPKTVYHHERLAKRSAYIRSIIVACGIQRDFKRQNAFRLAVQVRPDRVIGFRKRGFRDKGLLGAREMRNYRTAPAVAPMLDPGRNRSTALHYWKRIGGPVRRGNFIGEGSRTFGLYFRTTRCRMAFSIPCTSDSRDDIGSDTRAALQSSST